VNWLTRPVTPGAVTRWHAAATLSAAVYLVIRASALIDRGSSARFDGVGILQPLTAPLPSVVLVTAVVLAVSCLVATGLTSLGVGHQRPLVTIIGAASMLLVTTHRSSLGQILWFDVLMVLHVLVIAAHVALVESRSTDDAEVGRIAGWSVRLAALITVSTYVVAGVAKLRIGGVEWITGEALERHLSYTAARAEVLGGRPSPFANWALASPLPSRPFAMLTIGLELGAPLALTHRRAAWVWSALTWTMHAVIAATMFVIFHWPLLALAFVPVVLATGRGVGADA